MYILILDQIKENKFSIATRVSVIISTIMILFIVPLFSEHREKVEQSASGERKHEK